MAEGASAYRIQVATDPNFTYRVIDLVTPLNLVTAQNTLPQNTYYWRVQIVRYGNIRNDWAYGSSFEIALPSPQGLTPADDQIIHSSPTYCWQPLVELDEAGDAVFTAWKYRVQVSGNPNFSSIYNSAETYNNCWTPAIGYSDGAYYWRVAMIDSSNRLGPYSPAVTFVKLYSPTSLIDPISESISDTPTFVWSPVDGAASYVIEVSRYPTFSSIYDSQESINTQYTPTWIYWNNREYYWRVAIKDLNGKQGQFTSARFIIGEVHPSYLPQIRK